MIPAGLYNTFTLFHKLKHPPLCLACVVWKHMFVREIQLKKLPVHFLKEQINLSILLSPICSSSKVFISDLKKDTDRGLEKKNVLPFKHLRIQIVHFMNPDLCSFWILLYIDDTVVWYVMDKHDMNICSVCTPKLLTIFLQVTTSSIIKKVVPGSYCIIPTLSGLVAAYVGSRSLISGTSSTFLHLNGLSELNDWHTNTEEHICNYYIADDVKLELAWSVIFFFRSAYQLLSNMSITCFKFTY